MFFTGIYIKKQPPNESLVAVNYILITITILILK